MTDEEIEKLADRLVAKIVPAIVAVLPKRSGGEELWVDRPSADPKWAEDVFNGANRTWKRVPDPNGNPDLVLESTCAYCAAPIYHVIPYFAPHFDRQRDELPENTAVSCQCPHKHAGRPENRKSGCGYWGMVNLRGSIQG